MNPIQSEALLVHYDSNLIDLYSWKETDGEFQTEATLQNYFIKHNILLALKITSCFRIHYRKQHTIMRNKTLLLLWH
jgi:hypothetical protein